MASTLLPIALLITFAGYFAFDVITLRRALHHPDIITYYYPFRHWFVGQLKEWRFPTWNPYWGLGHAAEAWSSIPLDVYTLLELAIGPYYHYYLLVQLVLVLLSSFYVFRRLGFGSWPATAGTILFFMSPYVTHWFFSFLINTSYVAHVLLFYLVWRWHESSRWRYAFLIAATTALSMLGTKIEFWFYQTAYVGFLSLAVALCADESPRRERLKRIAVTWAAVAAGVLVNTWQLNIFFRLLGYSGRISNYGPKSLLDGDFYRSLALSVATSPLWQMFLGIALLVWLGAKAAIALAQARRRRVALATGIVVILAAGIGLAGALGAWGRAVSLPNPSFEAWTGAPGGGLLPSHTTYAGDGSCPEVVRLSGPENVRDGQYSAFLRPPQTGSCSLKVTIGEPKRDRKHLLRVAIWAKSENIVEDAIRFRLEEETGTEVVRTLPVSGRWRRVKLEMRVPATARELSLTVTVTARASAGVALDNLGAKAWVPLFRARRVTESALAGILARFATGPVLWGMLLGIVLAALGLGERDLHSHLRTVILFTPFVFYWCRPGPGDLDETKILALAPPVFVALMCTLVWLGCRRVGSSKVVNVAYLSVLFVLVMRGLGLVLLAYLTGVLWMPARDNYILDFAAVLLALSGLSSLTVALTDRLSGWRLARLLPGVLSLAVIVLTVGSAWADLYYSQPLMWKAAPDYPFYQGIPSLRRALHDLHAPPGTRVFLANYDAYGFTFGFGETLLEGLGQVTIYGSLIDQRYKDWTVFHHLGIRPEQHWGGYVGSLTAETAPLLPRKNLLGYPKETYYYHTVIARPPIRKDLLELLGVRYVVKLNPITHLPVQHLEPGQLEREIEALKPKAYRSIPSVARPGIQASMGIAELASPLPRAYVVFGLSSETLAAFERELSPRVLEGRIGVGSRVFQIAPAAITRYEADRVTVEAEADREGVLVLSDLYHPFWSVRLDGRPAEMFPALYLFRGVRIPPGRHRVEFECHIPGGGVALLASVAVLAACVGLCLACRRRPNF